MTTSILEKTNQLAAEQNREAWRLFFQAASKADAVMVVNPTTAEQYVLSLFKADELKFLAALNLASYQIRDGVAVAVGVLVRAKRAGSMKQIADAERRHDKAAAALHSTEPVLLREIAECQQRLAALREAATQAADEYHTRREQRRIMRERLPQHLRGATDQEIDGNLAAFIE